MRVAIVGSRDYLSRNHIWEFVERIYVKYPSAVIISGGCRGIDQRAEEAAYALGLAVVSFRPFGTKGAYGVRVVGPAIHTTEDEPAGTYRTYGDACYARNTWIVLEAEQVVAFWNGVSGGTRNTINEARRLDRPAHVMRG